MFNVLLSKLTFAQFGHQNIIDSTIFSIKEIVSGDINNDGNSDIIIAQEKWQGNNISYFLNSGNNQFGPQQILSNVSQTPNSVASGDLNNDGWIDVVTITLDSDSSVLWYPNSSGSFPSKILLDTNIISPEDVKIEDIDNDSDLDIIVLGHTNILTYKNDGIGNFTKETTPNTTFEYYDFFISDIDGDDFKDIIIGSGNPLIYKNVNGNFSYDTARTNSITNNGFVFLVSLNDLDNDGDKDLIIDGNTNDEIRWYANDGNGFFSLAQTIENTIQCKSVTSEDFDNDGDADIVASLYQEGEIVWFENTGNGVFASKEIISNGQAAHTTEVYTFDINNDNKSDIIWAHPLSFNINNFSLGGIKIKTSDIKIFPNPSSDLITIKSNENGTVKIYDELGHIVRDNIIIKKGDNLLGMALSSQIYFLEFRTEIGRSVGKIKLVVK